MRETHRFGEALRLVRHAKGISQDGLGMAQTNVSKLELNKYAPSWERVEICAAHLGVHPLTLFALSYLNDTSAVEMRNAFKVVASELGLVIKALEGHTDEEGSGLNFQIQS